MKRLWLTFLSCSLLACDDEPPPPPPPPDVSAVLARHQVDWPEAQRNRALTDGRAAIERHQCNRCHVIDDIRPARRTDHCTSCHVWLKGLARGHRHYQLLSSRYSEEVVQRYQRNIDHYQQVPELTQVARRLKPSWIDSFLASPFDLRPMMDESMMRTNLSDADREAIVNYFAAAASVASPYGSRAPAPSREPQPSSERQRQGKELFLSRGCVRCHTFGNVDTEQSVESLREVGWPAKLAPNLRFVRDRMHRDVLVAWIEDPQQLKSGTSMPDLQLTHEQAERVADFLIWGDPELQAPPRVDGGLPPLLSRPVPWEEVKEKVLGRICVHCHMNDHERDLGPGNEGGFGWPGSGLAMRTYETLVRGAVDAESSERYSVLEPRGESDTPPLIEVMLARRHEELRDRVAPFADHRRPVHRSSRPGMPMGLPHIPDDEVALVRTWIEQGCPGPTTVSGMSGITDGFLVPDGPIETNEGCELRMPAEERPAWSTGEPPTWARSGRHSVVHVEASGRTGPPSPADSEMTGRMSSVTVPVQPAAPMSMSVGSMRRGASRSQRTGE